MTCRTVADISTRVISSEVAWQQKSLVISGNAYHDFKWRYVKDSSESSTSSRAGGL